VAEMIDAARASGHLKEARRWIHPTTKSQVIYSAQVCLPDKQPSPPVAGRPILTGRAPRLESDANH